MEALNNLSLGLLALGVAYIMLKAVLALRIVPNRSSYIVERLGKYQGTLDAGFHSMIPFIDKIVDKLSLKEESIPVPPQECFTYDTVRVEVEAEIFISVVDPVRAHYGITDYRRGAIELAQTTIRSVIGQLELDDVIEERAKIKKAVVEALSQVQENWGIKVHRYEVKNVVPPHTVNKAMERQNNAQRERDGVLKVAQGKKESLIKTSEGEKSELINHSEGEKQKRINEAEGKAEEISQLAEATAESIEKLAEAIAAPGGQQAIELQVTQEYLDSLSALATEQTEIVLPTDLSDVNRLLEAVRDGIGGGQARAGS